RKFESTAASRARTAGKPILPRNCQVKKQKRKFALVSLRSSHAPDRSFPPVTPRWFSGAYSTPKGAPFRSHVLPPGSDASRAAVRSVYDSSVTAGPSVRGHRLSEDR